jgi:membrane protein insertase Oxa1/YidC/SpoIIIJ
VAVGMAFLSSQGPSAVALYWMMSGFSAVAVNLILMSPKMRRFVRIPKLDTESQHPYKQLASNFKLRLSHQSKFISGKLLKKD